MNEENGNKNKKQNIYIYVSHYLSPVITTLLLHLLLLCAASLQDMDHHIFLSRVALSIFPCANLLFLSSIHTSSSGKWLAVFYLSFPQYSPWGWSFPSPLFLIRCPRNFSSFFLIVSISVLSISIFFKTSLWLTRFAEFSVSFCETTFLLPLVFSSSLGKLSNIHCHIRRWWLSKRSFDVAQGRICGAPNED